jgi:tryptophanyl-tRNA synthetase
MASDIMLYRSTHVPVGVDQVQHLELSNKITERFNKLFKISYFPEIKYIESPQPKVMSLTDPDKKMSKS